MPFVNIKTIKGALSPSQKTELHKRIADLMIEIEGKGNERLRPYVMVMIEELEPQNVGVGGNQATKDFVKKITGGA
jgi:4-oxalocrotonate tautomerase